MKHCWIGLITCALLFAALLLTGCAARDAPEREARLQERYAAMVRYAGTVEASVVRDGETAHYALEISREGDAARVTVVAPEELAGVTATLTGDALEIGCDGMVLDAGSVDESITAVNAADIVLRAVGTGWIVERSAEQWEDIDALRLCFETERGGETLRTAVWFNEYDLPLYAELERGGEILAYLEFTDFGFDAIIPEATGNDTT